MLWRADFHGAGDETRTRDVQLGRLELYQLSYSRMIGWWGVDLNHRSRMTSDLQSDPFGHSGTPPESGDPKSKSSFCSFLLLSNLSNLSNLSTKWSWRWDLNPRPSDYKSDALPTELHQQDRLQQTDSLPSLVHRVNTPAESIIRQAVIWRFPSIRSSFPNVCSRTRLFASGRAQQFRLGGDATATAAATQWRREVVTRVAISKDEVATKACGKIPR